MSECLRASEAFRARVWMAARTVLDLSVAVLAARAIAALPAGVEAWIRLRASSSASVWACE
jgi:hypothetical protein